METKEFKVFEFRQGDDYVLQFHWAEDRVIVNVVATVYDTLAKRDILMVEDIDVWHCEPGVDEAEVRSDCEDYFAMYLENAEIMERESGE
jgi:hypothetical protein